MTKFSFRFHAQKSDRPQTRMGEVLALVDTTRVRIILIAGIALFALSYLWLVNSSAARGFYLSDLENNVITLEEEYRGLEIKQTALRSLDHVQEQSQTMGMVASGTVEYATGDTAVAVADNE
ncbi:MAG: hypothetical protein ABIG66_01595 [Candidatus Kerfeldbacteria bacterium]